MKGNPKLIEALNQVLTGELTAINQYFLHSRMCRNWGFHRLAKHAYDESIGEMKHADEIIERILYLDGVPNMQKYMKINVGQTVPEQHQYDLALEKDAVARLNQGVELCRVKEDNGTRALLEKILRDEEEHVDWLESQLLQIQDIGLPNYLSQQIDD